MSENHVIKVILEDEVVVSQFVQTDLGYNINRIEDFFAGTGIPMVIHLLGWGPETERVFIDTPDHFHMDHFKSQLRKCVFLTESELDSIYAKYATDGMMNLRQVDTFVRSEFGHLHRDVGAAILPFIYNNKDDKIVLSNTDAGTFTFPTVTVNLDTQEITGVFENSVFFRSTFT